MQHLGEGLVTQVPPGDGKVLAPALTLQPKADTRTTSLTASTSLLFQLENVLGLPGALCLHLLLPLLFLEFTGSSGFSAISLSRRVEGREGLDGQTTYWSGVPSPNLAPGFCWPPPFCLCFAGASGIWRP